MNPTALDILEESTNTLKHACASIKGAVAILLQTEYELKAQEKVEVILIIKRNNDLIQNILDSNINYIASQKSKGQFDTKNLEI